ncbi:hypothetical protein Q1695_006502 [Nippostrongylus brasiliensis]|nr:hypothetical protein Q1695_006502 [Nippostrongylus brasiliensis]
MARDGVNSFSACRTGRGHEGGTPPPHLAAQPTASQEDDRRNEMVITLSTACNLSHIQTAEMTQCFLWKTTDGIRNTTPLELRSSCLGRVGVERGENTDAFGYERTKAELIAATAAQRVRPERCVVRSCSKKRI